MSDLVAKARAALDGVTPDSELTILESEWFCEIGYVDGNGMGIWEETIESHPLKTLAQAEALRDEWLKSGKLYRTSWGELRPTGVNYGAFCIRKGSRILPAARSLVPDMADRIEALEAENARLRDLLRQEREDVLYHAYACGIERDGKWMDGGMSDGEWLQRECGLPDEGWHDAATVRALIPEAAKRFAEARHD